MGPAFIPLSTSTFTPYRHYQHSFQSLSNRRPLSSTRHQFHILPSYPATALADPDTTITPTPNVSTSTTITSNTTSSSSSSSSSQFRHRYENLRGADIEPVSATVGRFNKSFMRPVPVVYRSIINEMLTTAHLASVCAMWRYDAIFAFGFDSIFSVFLQYYPDDKERESLYKCAVESLRMDFDIIKQSAQSVKSWIDGKTQDDIFQAINAASPSASIDSVGPVIEALAYIRDADSFDWYYSRLFGIGLIQVMQSVGAELTVPNAEIWANKIGLDQGKFATEMSTYISNMERLKQAEQIFAEATAREAKKTAERLDAKAKAAAKQAEELEKDENEIDIKTQVKEDVVEGEKKQDEVEKST